MRKTNAERQQALAERRVAAGMRPHRVWVSDSDAEQLRRQFQGPRNGIDWQAVIRAVLGIGQASKRQSPIQPEDSEPHLYWRPNGQRDPRCQAATVSGKRCQSAGTVIVKELDTNGKLGEFASCKRHEKAFTPHKSVMR